MNISIFLVLCAVTLIHAIPRPSQSPFFTVRDGVLVRRDGNPAPITGKIIGGGEAEPFSAPWIVSLQWGTLRPNHFCGGAIINPNWVVTAGHCILAYPPYGIPTVVAGLHDLNEFSGIVQIRHVTLTNTWVHEDYNGYNGPHDIGLLVFQTPFSFDLYASAIALPEPDEIHTGVAVLHGWGSTSDSVIPNFPNVLQEADLPIVPLQTCRNEWAPFPVDDNNVCAGELAGGANACEMDQGGPLTQNDELVGIASWFYIPCGLPNRPSVYVRVSAYVSWIEETINSVLVNE